MGSKVLLADDSVTIQKVVGIIFANEGFDLTVVASGEAAMAKARETKPDVMLIDALMPGKNGYEVCREIRQDPALAHTAILLMTGAFEAVDEERNKQSGADDFITKPFESQALIDVTNRLIALTAERAAAPQAPAAAVAATAVTAAAAAAPVVAPATPQVDDIWATGFDDEPAVTAPAPEAAVFDLTPEMPAAVKVSADDDLWGAFDMDAEQASPAAAPQPAAATVSAAMSDDIFSFDSDLPATAAEDEFILEEVALDEPAAAPVFQPPPTATGFEPVDEQEIHFGDTVAPLPSYAAPAAAPAEDDFSTISFEEEAPAPVAAPAPAPEDFSTIAFTEEPPAPVASPVQPVVTPVVEAVAPAFVPPVAPVVTPAAPAAAMGDDEIKAIIAGLSREVIERIVWEVVPDLAETLIKEEIRKLKAGIA
jgi:CheY-like chemotaxis protein